MKEMKEKLLHETVGLKPDYQTYKRQKCFVGYSYEDRHQEDIKSACGEVLKKFDLEPAYADDHFDPTQPLRDVVVQLIKNAQYGIYNISEWLKKGETEKDGRWRMPCNVLIELGIAISLNRPTLLLWHKDNEEYKRTLPAWLESIHEKLLVFSGKPTLMDILNDHIPSHLTHTTPEQDWLNTYCNFGGRVCEYRKEEPRNRQAGQTICCHISDSPDRDQRDFRRNIEEVLKQFSKVKFEYLDEFSISNGYDFLLCTYCQKVRSTPFAIYRITPKTLAETYISIGISLGLEEQFGYKVPKILLTENIRDIPSLLAGYQVVVAQDHKETTDVLNRFIPIVMRNVREASWKPRPLPFIEIVPQPIEEANAEDVIIPAPLPPPVPPTAR